MIIVTRRTKESEMLRLVKVAVCGELPTVCEYLTKQGVIHIDKYSTATDMGRESDYHLILVHAPSAEGFFNTYVQMSADGRTIPMKLLGEPCCRSALLAIKMTVQDIARSIQDQEHEDSKTHNSVFIEGR